MVPYSSLNRIHGWINCEKHMKKKSEKKKLTNKCPSKERKGKVSIHSHENQCK